MIHPLHVFLFIYLFVFNSLGVAGGGDTFYLKNLY